ncbi:MAG: threonine--tRNA ligase, partial [Candidatus Margulisbacteria bacterium]|nr:threonine--tRNA ligase [Candidatus Margulisiibacteriota bacterium]
MSTQSPHRRPSKGQPNPQNKDKPTVPHHELRHSTSHVLAQAVLKVFPDAKLGIGPPIEDGFYYDFELPRPLTPEDLPILEKHMKSIIKEAQLFIHSNKTKDEALKLMTDMNQTYKVQLIEDLGFDEFSFYENGPFLDLCKGPHIKSTSEITAFKLLKIAGAYWKGSEKNPMLQRIYGTAF